MPLLFNRGLVEGFPAFLFPGFFSSSFRGFDGGRGWFWSSYIDPDMIVRTARRRDLISSYVYSIQPLLLLPPLSIRPSNLLHHCLCYG